MSLENLKYLSSRQALADLASFIKGIKAMNPNLQNAPCIVFGGSYSGMNSCIYSNESSTGSSEVMHLVQRFNSCLTLCVLRMFLDTVRMFLDTKIKPPCFLAHVFKPSFEFKPPL